MGNFYVNYTVRSSDAQAVAKAFSGRRAFVTSVPGQPVVTFDEAADSQEEAVVKGLGCHLSEAAGVPVLGVLNHDDDILWCGLFESGQCVDEYDSSPDYFKDEGEPRGPTGGDASKLCQAFGSDNREAVESILRNDDYVFACERHEALVKALGLPTFGVASSFAYISQGEMPLGLSPNHLLKVG